MSDMNTGAIENNEFQAAAGGALNAVAKPKRLTVFGVEFVYLYLLGIGMAFVGWIAENTVKAISSGIIDARFHALPFISPYALIPFAFHIVYRSADDLTFFGRPLFRRKNKRSKILSNVCAFTFTCGAVFLGELAIGNLWDKLFGVQLWNYSGLPFQVTQYAGLIPSLGYGGGAYLILKFVHTPLLNTVRQKVPFKAAKAVDCTLGVLIVLDTFVMVLQIVLFHEAAMLWSIRF